MHDAGRGRMPEGRGQLQRVVDCLARVELAVIANDVTDRAAGDELVRDEVESTIFPDVIDAGDVVVIEPCRGPCLVEKPLDRTVVTAERRGQDLEATTRSSDVHRKDGSHAAGADRAFDTKVTEAATDGRRRALGRRSIPREQGRDQSEESSARELTFELPSCAAPDSRPSADRRTQSGTGQRGARAGRARGLAAPELARPGRLDRPDKDDPPVVG